MPEMGLTLPIKGRFSQTLKVENQHFLFRDGANETGRFEYAYEQTDLQLFVNMKLAAIWKASIGYQLRIEQQWNTHHRPIQQVAASQRLGNLRLGHRIRTDETIERDAPFLFRFRYRAALEIPLSGESLDPGEFYAVLSDEPIYMTQAGTHGLENRLVATIGHFFSNRNKLEVSIDHRTDRFFDNGLRQRIWLKVGWFVNIKDL